MLTWLRAIFAPPQPLGAPRLVRAFQPGDPTASNGPVIAGPDCWRIDSLEQKSLTLFDLRRPVFCDCLLTYRAELRCESPQATAWLELEAHLPERGPVGTKGYHHTLQGDNQWRLFEISLPVLGPGAPDLVRLNLGTEGPGPIEIRKVKLLATPMG